MWYREVTIKTNATREQIWNLWVDVENWKKWDNQVEFSQLNGNFEKGTYGILKTYKSPKAKFQIVLAKELEEFTTRSFLPLTQMDFIHKINEKNGEIYITHGVKIRGLFTFLFSRIIGQKILKELPKVMENLSKMAEK
ncbi:MAG: hypothetical protein CSA15_03895 [Candidatus Delongbacteria bacterium]|nr:MAG: hypothetical protein CSA15_03895 [Candidatus Delongbacteria bacterium]